MVLRRERKLRGLDTAAPPAGQHLAHRNATLLELGAEPSRLRSSDRTQVALSHAVIELEARRITNAGVGRTMADQEDMAAGSQAFP